MIARSTLVVWLWLGVVASTAGAESLHLDAERCPLVDARELAASVDRELALDPELVALARKISVVVECADGLHAAIRIDPDPHDGPLSRDLDLNEEPADLRVKFVALAVVELIVDAASPEPELAPPSAALVEPIWDVPVRRSAEPTKRAPRITMRAGIRVFADDQAPMPTVSAELDVGPFEVGLASAIGSDNRFAGIPYVVAVAARRRVVCSHGRTSLCLVATGEAGFAGVSIRANPTMMDHSVHSGYGDIAVGLEVERQFDGWKGLVGMDLGGADGLVVEARYLEHLDGPFASVGIGATW